MAVGACPSIDLPGGDTPAGAECCRGRDGWSTVLGQIPSEFSQKFMDTHAFEMQLMKRRLRFPPEPTDAPSYGACSSGVANQARGIHSRLFVYSIRK